MFCLETHECEMIGACEHQQICTICGNGWGCSPDPCSFVRDLIKEGVEKVLDEYGEVLKCL